MYMTRVANASAGISTGPAIFLCNQQRLTANGASSTNSTNNCNNAERAPEGNRGWVLCFPVDAVDVISGKPL